MEKKSADTYLAAFRADPQNAPLALYAGAALDREGRRDEALAVWTFGDDANPALRSIRHHPEASAQMRAHSSRADTAIRDHFNGLHLKTINDFAATLEHDDLDRIRNGVWTHYHKSAVDFRTPMQAPLIFYVPDLPAAPICSNEVLPWVDDIAAAYTQILSEYNAAGVTNAQMEPYVPVGEPGQEWAKLQGKLDWSALYLFYNAEPTEHNARFPKTLAALEHADLLRKNGAPIELFFSRLTPGAHIPPHCGLTNTRLTVHLPLIVPQGCSIRVGDKIHHWQEGEIVAFDDSFEHEAWNKSDSDRIVLIFETHHPDLSHSEREAIERIYAAFDAWVAGRSQTIGFLQPK